MKTHIIYLLFTFCILSGIYAQNMNISGRVTDGKGELLAFLLGEVVIKETRQHFKMENGGIHILRKLL